MIFNFFKKTKPLTTYEYNKKYSNHLITTLDGNERVELSYKSRFIDGVGFFFFLEVARVKKVDILITDGILFITITKKDIGKDFTKLFNLNGEVKNKPYSSSASLRSIKNKIHYQYKINAYQLEKLGENPIIEHKVRNGVLNIFIKKQKV